MFLSRNKKNNVYPFKSQFYYIKVGFKGVKIILACFRDVSTYVVSLWHIAPSQFAIVLGFNNTSTLVGYFVSFPRTREKKR